jgi:hypothetical protein
MGWVGWAAELPTPGELAEQRAQVVAVLLDRDLPGLLGSHRIHLLAAYN